ncbi:MAG: hypothetical protein ABL908_14460, partial [Hyphomicrobium sp.]
MKNQPFHRRLSFALAGIGAALRSENSFRTQFAAAIALVESAAHDLPAVAGPHPLPAAVAGELAIEEAARRRRLGRGQ